MMYPRVFVFVALLLAASAQALTNGSATLSWDKTTDPTIRYELRWMHFANGWQWTTIATNLDSTLGIYQHTWPVFADSTGDRGACWDIRRLAMGDTPASVWVSEQGKQACNQIPLAAAPTPIPVPLPTPEPVPPPPPPSSSAGLRITSSSPEVVVITASAVDCPRVVTSTAGTSKTTLKRTITCVK